MLFPNGRSEQKANASAMTPAAVLRGRAKEAAKAPALADVIRGTLLRYSLTCGNPDCRCRRSKRNRHGPYWYVSVSYGKGRQRRYLIPASQVARAKRGIAAYGRLWESLCRISEFNLDLLRIER